MNPVGYKEVFDLLQIILKVAGFGQKGVKENCDRKEKILVGFVWSGRAFLVSISADLFWYALKAYQNANLMIVVVNGKIDFL